MLSGERHVAHVPKKQKKIQGSECLSSCSTIQFHCMTVSGGRGKRRHCGDSALIKDNSFGVHGLKQDARVSALDQPEVAEGGQQQNTQPMASSGKARGHGPKEREKRIE